MMQLQWKHRAYGTVPAASCGRTAAFSVIRRAPRARAVCARSQHQQHAAPSVEELRRAAVGTGTAALFEPLQLGPYELKHRVVMAPLTRCR